MQLRADRPTAHRPQTTDTFRWRIAPFRERQPEGHAREGASRQTNARAAPALRPTHGWAAVVNVLLARRMQTVALKAICTEACGLPARPCHVCAGSGLTQPASLPIGNRQWPHLRRDCYRYAFFPLRDNATTFDEDDDDFTLGADESVALPVPCLPGRMRVFVSGPACARACVLAVEESILHRK